VALIIEDGSIVPNANSYVTVAEIKAYADLRGMTYPADAQIEQNAILATDYLQSKCYLGELVEETQPLLWPRQDVWVNGYELSSTSIPNDLKNAQIELALAAYTQSLLNDGSDTGENIKSEKTDMIETQYYEGGKSSVFNSQRVNSYLQKYLEPVGLLRV
jgi:hypothetical protein